MQQLLAQHASVLKSTQAAQALKQAQASQQYQTAGLGGQQYAAQQQQQQYQQFQTQQVSQPQYQAQQYKAQAQQWQFDQQAAASAQQAGQYQQYQASQAHLQQGVAAGKYGGAAQHASVHPSSGSNGLYAGARGGPQDGSLLPHLTHMEQSQLHAQLQASHARADGSDTPQSNASAPAPEEEDVLKMAEEFAKAEAERQKLLNNVDLSDKELDMMKRAFIAGMRLKPVEENNSSNSDVQWEFDQSGSLDAMGFSFDDEDASNNKATDSLAPFEGYLESINLLSPDSARTARRPPSQAAAAPPEGSWGPLQTDILDGQLGSMIFDDMSNSMLNMSLDGIDTPRVVEEVLCVCPLALADAAALIPLGSSCDCTHST